MEVWLFQAASRLHFLHEMGAEIHWGPYKPAVPLMVVSDPISQCLSLSSNMERLAAKGEHHFLVQFRLTKVILLNGVMEISRSRVSGLLNWGYTPPWIGSLVSQEMVKLSFFWVKISPPKLWSPQLNASLWNRQASLYQTVATYLGNNNEMALFKGAGACYGRKNGSEETHSSQKPSPPTLPIHLGMLRLTPTVGYEG